MTNEEFTAAIATILDQPWQQSHARDIESLAYGHLNEPDNRPEDVFETKIVVKCDLPDDTPPPFETVVESMRDMKTVSTADGDKHEPGPILTIKIRVIQRVETDDE